MKKKKKIKKDAIGIEYILGVVIKIKTDGKYEK